MSAFRILSREFFSQFFISESVLSDHQFTVAVISALVFLILPSVVIPAGLADRFDAAARHLPLLVSPLTRLMATVFVTFAMVAVGLVGAFEWDALGFDRRDSMILGTLPISARTIVAAKLAALGVLLLIAASGVNLVAAVLFSIVATIRQPMIATARLFIAHLVGTMSASTFAFSILVTVRGAASLAGRGRVGIGTFVQFLLISSLLCFMVFAPASLRLQISHVSGRPDRVIGVRMQPIPTWSPTNWFVGLYDTIRGDPDNGARDRALTAVTATLGGVAVAIVTVVAGYRRELRTALLSSERSRSPRAFGALARFLAGRRREAQAVADFIVITLAGQRAQQAQIAMNAALAVATVAIELTWRGSDFGGLSHPSLALSRIPLLLAFWLAVGLRASFFVPSELPAAWTFCMTGNEAVRASHGAIRGVGVTLIALPMAVLALALSSVGTAWREAAMHAIVVGLAVCTLVELVALTVTFTPFTRPYETGHARLKILWPCYLAGVYLFGYVLVAIEKRCAADSGSYLVLLGVLAAIVVTLDVIGERYANRRSLDGLDEVWSEDEGRIAVLGLSG